MASYSVWSLVSFTSYHVYEVHLHSVWLLVSFNCGIVFQSVETIPCSVCLFTSWWMLQFLVFGCCEKCIHQVVWPGRTRSAAWWDCTLESYKEGRRGGSLSAWVLPYLVSITKGFLVLWPCVPFSTSLKSFSYPLSLLVISVSLSCFL